MKNLWKMKMDELRAVAVELGADRNKLYGTSKQAIIAIIHELKKNAETTTTTTTKATVKKPRAKKSTKTTKKAAELTTVTVVLKAFTGMKIAIYTGTLQDSTITITTKNGKEMEFNLDGTQKTQKPGQNPKFNNRIEVVAEA